MVAAPESIAQQQQQQQQQHQDAAAVNAHASNKTGKANAGQGAGNDQPAARQVENGGEFSLLRHSVILFANYARTWGQFCSSSLSWVAVPRHPGWPIFLRPLYYAMRLKIAFMAPSTQYAALKVDAEVRATLGDPAQRRLGAWERDLASHPCMPYSALASSHLVVHNTRLDRQNAHARLARRCACMQLSYTRQAVPCWRRVAHR